jgi:hypothetical protein
LTTRTVRPKTACCGELPLRASLVDRRVGMTVTYSLEPYLFPEEF